MKQVFALSRNLFSLYCSSTETDWEKGQWEPAERFSGRMGPFSGSDQVSAVVKLSLFGRKNSKHEPMQAAHSSAGILSGSCHERPVFNSCFWGFFRICSSLEILIEASSSQEDIVCEFLNGAPNVLKVFCVNSSTLSLRVHTRPRFSFSLSFAVYTPLNTF